MESGDGRHPPSRVSSSETSMHSSIRTLSLLSLLGAATLSAQGPGGPPPRAGGGGRGGRGGPGELAPAAQLLLAHTGELDLTDAQVVKLAAIARRGETQRRAMRAT